MTLVNQQEVLEKELRRKIQILEKQVADSEEAKAKAEMTLTEQTSRPQTETEAQMTYIRYNYSLFILLSTLLILLEKLWIVLDKHIE